MAVGESDTDAERVFDCEGLALIVRELVLVADSELLGLREIVRVREGLLEGEGGMAIVPAKL